MAGSVHGSAQCRYVVAHRTGGVDMGDQYRLDLVIGVFGETGFEHSGINRVAVGSSEHLDFDI